MSSPKRVCLTNPAEVPPEHLKYIRHGCSYDNERGVMYMDVVYLTDAEKEKVKKFIRERGSFLAVTILKNEADEDVLEQWGVTVGFSPDGAIVNLISPDDPDLHTKINYDEDAGGDCFPQLYCKNHHILADGDKVEILNPDTFWGDSDIDDFEEIMYVWVECYMQDIPLLLVDH